MPTRVDILGGVLPEARLGRFGDTSLLARIACDPRHAGMSVLDRSRTGARLFGGWSMGWLRASDLERAGLDPDVLFLRDTPDAVVNALLGAFRLAMRVA